MWHLIAYQDLFIEYLIKVALFNPWTRDNTYVHFSSPSLSPSLYLSFSLSLYLSFDLSLYLSFDLSLYTSLSIT